MALLSKVGLKSNHEVKKDVSLKRVPLVEEGVYELRIAAERLTC